MEDGIGICEGMRIIEEGRGYDLIVDENSFDAVRAMLPENIDKPLFQGLKLSYYIFSENTDLESLIGPEERYLSESISEGKGVCLEMATTTAIAYQEMDLEPHFHRGFASLDGNWGKHAWLVVDETLVDPSVFAAGKSSYKRDLSEEETSNYSPGRNPVKNLHD